MTHLYAKATAAIADTTVKMPNNRAAAPADVNLEPGYNGTITLKAFSHFGLPCMMLQQ